MNDYAIYTDQLTKRFGKFIAADSVNLRISHGEIYGFLGPNGAGKSTTIRMLCGIIEPSSGSGRVLDFDIVKQVEQIRMRIGYMSQKFSLYEDLTVLENLSFFAGIYQVPENIKKDRIEEMLKMAGLSERKKELTRNLSMGWKQRLSFACAIIHEPELLILDEPTSGVDPLSRRNFWDLIYALSEKKVTVMVTTHNMDEAEHCDRLGFIYDGKLIAEGSPSELKHHEMNGELVEINANPLMNTIDTLKTLSEVREAALYGTKVHLVTDNAEKNKTSIINALTRNGVQVTDYKTIPPALEDVFISLVEESRKENIRVDFAVERAS